MVKINTSKCEITCNIKVRPGGGGGIGAAAAAWPGRWGWPEAADELAGNSRGLAGSSRWAGRKQQNKNKTKMRKYMHYKGQARRDA